MVIRYPVYKFFLQINSGFPENKSSRNKTTVLNAYSTKIIQHVSVNFGSGLKLYFRRDVALNYKISAFHYSRFL